jgi:hypothetical protein
MATQWTAGTTSGQVLTAATMNTIGAAWETWTPTLTASTTNPTLGTGSTATGKYGRVNKQVFGNVTITFGTSGVAPGTGFYYVSVPVTAIASGVTVGSGFILDSSTGLLRHVELSLDSTSRMSLLLDNTSSYGVGAANPWTWAASDQFRLSFTYEAA